MPYFFIKLIPPRPSFAQDMTEIEREIMQEHKAYWTDLQNKGIVVVFGPVLDSKGVWGMGIIKAEDEAQVHNLMAKDPSILKDLNTVEICPMMAVLKSA